MSASAGTCPVCGLWMATETYHYVYDRDGTLLSYRQAMVCTNPLCRYREELGTVYVNEPKEE